MPYVRRDAKGDIDSVHRTPSVDAIEYLDAADPEISKFFDQATGPVAEVDSPLPLIFDSTLDVLLAKGVLSISELSPEAQAAWLLRKELKARQEKKRFVASGFVEIIDDSAFGSLAG
jgi:hypothetical protein